MLGRRIDQDGAAVFFLGRRQLDRHGIPPRDRERLEGLTVIVSRDGAVVTAYRNRSGVAGRLRHAEGIAEPVSTVDIPIADKQLENQCSDGTNRSIKKTFWLISVARARAEEVSARQVLERAQQSYGSLD